MSTTARESDLGSLVLSRRVEEAIRIGDDITIKIVSFHGGHDNPKVRLMITAPKDVPIMRTELLTGEPKTLMEVL